MIKPVPEIALSSSKARLGMTRVSELLPRLIRSYELQAQLVQQRELSAAVPLTVPLTGAPCLVQATFDWYATN